MSYVLTKRIQSDAKNWNLSGEGHKGPLTAM